MHKQIAALATDEDHIVMWDIDGLLSDYEKAPCISVDTKILVPQNWLRIDTEYARKTNPDKPIYLFELPDNSLYIADGNHRLYKAAAEHIPKMNVVIIPQEIHLSYLYHSSVDTYLTVIEGLKNEGIFIKNFQAPLVTDAAITP